MAVMCCVTCCPYPPSGFMTPSDGLGCWPSSISAEEYWADSFSPLSMHLTQCWCDCNGLANSTETRIERHAVDGQAAPGKLCRRARQLGAHAEPVRLFLLYRGLARSHY